MTTLHQSREYERIASAVQFVARRWWWVKLGQRLLIWLAGSLALLTGLAGAAGLFNIPSEWRSLMLAALFVAPAVGLVLIVIWPLRRRLTDQQAARQIEQTLGGLENRYINAIQLADNGQLFEPELVRRTIEEIAHHTGDVPLDQAVRTNRLRAAAAVAGAVGVVFGFFVLVAGDRFAYGLGRLWSPERRSWVGRIRIDEVVPGNKTVAAGERLTIELAVSTSSDRFDHVEALLWRRQKGEAHFSPLKMSARQPIGKGNRQGRYYYAFTSVLEDFEYYVSIDDTNESDSPYRITVEQITCSGQISARYPDYLRHEQPDKPLGLGSFEAPQGATAEVTATISRPVVSAELSVSLPGPPGEPPSVRALAMSPQPGRQTWVGQMDVLRSGQYRVLFRDEHEQVVHAVPSLRRGGAEPADPSTRPDASAVQLYQMTARADNPPSVQVLRPGSDSTVRPGGWIDLTFQAADDHGLAALRLMVAKVKRGASADAPGELDCEPAQVRHAWPAGELTDSEGRPRKLAKVTYTLRPGEACVSGDRLVYWVEAADNRQLAAWASELGLADGGGPQTRASDRFILTVQDAVETAAQQKKLLEQLMAHIAELLKEQTETRAATVGLTRHGEEGGPADFDKAAGQVKAAQSGFADHLLRLAKGKIVSFDADTRPIQTTLLVLAYNDSADAKAMADSLVEAMAAWRPRPEGKEKDAAHPVKLLVARQDRIIYALQSLLGLIGQVEKRTEEATTRPDGSDLPPDVQARWRKLADDLKDLMEQQKKDIAVAQTLAKKPVDEFTRDDLLELEKLVANQEKWEKFLEQAISDFSKLAEQDFSNPTLLRELIEIKDDVVMAKDALQKKAVEIAVPLEEAGLEMAEALTTHIEKWLPDTPDREKWSMEEPTEQHDVPMAELPKELEDMVGALMEEQEDLFDEIEDATSKWTDSLDKGAGWDAMDGPISNMSAQGVTGNRLPNTSEISGRSGEGRTGKASGEMVEQEATGKGGRDTPTRLSGDPFQAGQVKDSSKEPPGGATGGGKVSGVAGEGLEGPVPAELQKELQRLAQKQASIRNKAEAVDARFRANNFNHFALQKALGLMHQTEADLSNYRYQNALRKRSVLVNNLHAQQMLLRGEIVVQADRSAELPDMPRKDIRSGNDDDLPPRYKDLARQYLQALSDQAAGSSDK